MQRHSGVVAGVLVLLVSMGAITSGVIGSSAASDFEISASGTIDVPDRTLTFEGEDYTISSIAVRDPGDPLSVSVDAPSGTSYSIQLRNADNQIVDIKNPSGSGSATFQTSGLDPGPYVVAVSENGSIRTIYSAIIEAYDVTADIPTSAHQDSTITVTASLTERSSLAIERVEVILANHEIRRTVVMSKSGDEYSANVSLDGLSVGSYPIYVAVRGTKEAYDRKIPIGVSDDQTLDITQPPTTQPPTPTESSPSGGLGGGAGGGGGGAGGGAAPSLKANVDVTEESANRAKIVVQQFSGDSQTGISVPTMALRRDTGVSLDLLEMSTASATDFQVTVDQLEQPPTGTSPVDAEVPAAPLTYYRIEHNLSDDQIRTANLTFSVDKSRLASDDTSPDQITVFHYTDDQWMELETDVTDETDSFYSITATLDGFSVFAVGIEQPSLTIAQATVGQPTLTAGESTTITATVENTGGITETFRIDLIIDDAVVAHKNVTMAAGESTEVSFTHTFDDPGTFDVSISDATAGTLTVESAQTTTPPPTTSPKATTPPPSTSASTATIVTPNQPTTLDSTSDDQTTTPGQPGFTVPMVLVVFLVLALLRSRFA